MRSPPCSIILTHTRGNCHAKAKDFHEIKENRQEKEEINEGFTEMQRGKTDDMYEYFALCLIFCADNERKGEDF